MTRTLFLVPRATQRRPALICVWTATGNRCQPLTRAWTAETRTTPADNRKIEPEPRPRRALMCA